MMNAISLMGVDAHRFRAYDWIKPAIDIAVAGVLLTIALPVLLLAGLLVKLTSAAPSFTARLGSVVRVGRSGSTRFERCTTTAKRPAPLVCEG